MATNWNEEWDKDEWLKKQNVVTLYRILGMITAPSEAEKEAKKSKIKEIAVEQLQATDGETLKAVSPFELLSYLRIAEATDLGILEIKDAAGNTRDLKEEIRAILNKEEKNLENKDDLVSRLKRKAVLEGLKVIEDEATKEELQKSINTEKPLLEGELKKEVTNRSIDEMEAFYKAKDSGTLSDIDSAAIDAFINQLAKLSNWEKIDGQLVSKNDSELSSIIKSLDVYDKDGNLTDIYSDCADLAEKLTFEYPEGTTDAQQGELAKAYKQQLLANAAMRATNEFLKNRTLLFEHKTAETLLDAYKTEIHKQFERSVVIAGLTSRATATGIMLEHISRDEDGKIIYEGDILDEKNQKIDAADAIADILKGDQSINPVTVHMDTYQLEVENRVVADVLKGKKVKTEKLKLWSMAKTVYKAAKENIFKKGGWKKVVVNGAIFGGAAALMASGSLMVVGIGAAAYAGWSSSNAKLMPIYDLLSNEMHERKITGLRARIAYLKKNWSRAKKAKENEAGFKSRSNQRVIASSAVALLSFGMSFAGINPGTKTVARQGAMAADKGISWGRSIFRRRKAEKDLKKTYSIGQYNVLQTAQNYQKQDQYAFLATVLGATVTDAVKSYMEDGVVAEVVHKIPGLGGNDATETVAEVEVPEAEVPEAEVSETTDGKVASEATDSKATDATDGKVAGGKATDATDGKAAGGKATDATDGKAAGGKATDATDGKAAGGKATEATTYAGHELNANGPYNYKDVDFSKYEHLNAYDRNAMGITFQSYKTLIRVYGAKELDRMMAALDRKGVMDNFKDMGLTKEQLLVRFRGLDATTDRVGKDGFSIQGATRYHHEEGMTYLNKLLGPCGDQITPEQYAVIKESLKVMDNQGGYHGEGIVPTSSVHIKGHGYNTDNCGQGELNQFRVGSRINTPTPQPEVVEPVQPEPASEPEPVVEVVDPVEVVTPVEPITTSVEPGEVYGFNSHYAQQELKLDFAEAKDAPKIATAVYAGGRHDYNVYASAEDGKVINVSPEGVDVYVKEDPTLVNSDGVTTNNHEVRFQAAGDYVVPDGHAQVTSRDNTVIFSFGDRIQAHVYVGGKTHVFFDDKELFLTPKAAGEWGAKLESEIAGNEDLAKTFQVVKVDEADNSNSHLESIVSEKKLSGVVRSINRKISGVETYSETTTTIEPPAPEVQPITITAEQQQALLSDDAKIIAIGLKNGQMAFTVKGVDGIDHLEMPLVRSVTLADDEPVTYTDYKSDGSHKYLFKIRNEKGMVYSALVGEGIQTRILDDEGNPVLLDATSGETIGKACREALEKDGIKDYSEINLSAYPKGSLGAKCADVYVKAVQAARAAASKTR